MLMHWVWERLSASGLCHLVGSSSRTTRVMCRLTAVALHAVNADRHFLLDRFDFADVEHISS